MYVILGATGKTGSAVVESLLAQKRPVRVVVRSAEKAAAWKARGAEVAEGQVSDPASLERAFQGASGAYVLVPPDLTTPEVLARGRRIVDAVADALQVAKVPHVVLLSSLGAELAEGTGVVKYLYYGEQRLGALGGALTSLRAGYFIENWAGLIPVAVQNGILPSALTIDRKLAMVATKDIGAVAAGALVDPPSAGKRVIEITGPEDLSPADIAASFSRLLGKTIAPVQIGMEDLKKAFVGMGASADIGAQFAELNEAINAGKVSYGVKGATLVRGSTGADAVLGPLIKR
jgi:uncharacterized protein YbjT (DUF2867 family)